MLSKTAHSTVRRLPQRASYDRQIAHAIIDEALVCHVGFIADQRPVVIPTNHWRVGDTLYFHGSVGSRLAKVMASGAEVCLSIALVDGLVLARSAFHHSMNYRSLVLFGRASAVDDAAAKQAALAALVDKLSAGRSGLVRAPNDKELAITRVACLPIDEGSVKLRAGPPVDDEADLARPVWAGVIPLTTAWGTPEPADGVSTAAGLPTRP
jgi:hypothetical protein